MHEILLASFMNKVRQDLSMSHPHIPIVNYPHDRLKLPFLYIRITEIIDGRHSLCPPSESFINARIDCSLKASEQGQSLGFSLLHYFQNALDQSKISVTHLHQNLGSLWCRLHKHHLEPKETFCLDLQMVCVFRPQ